jgi:catecholate siderophore receptor
VELTADLDLPSGWRAVAGYSYLDARVTRSIAVDDGQAVEGKRATITQQHSANLFVTKSFRRRYGFGAAGDHVSDRFANPGNTVTLPSYLTVDALGWVQFGKLRLQVNAKNLFDRRCIASGRGTWPNLNLPGSPRTVLGTLRLDHWQRSSLRLGSASDPPLRESARQLSSDRPRSDLPNELKLIS